MKVVLGPSCHSIFHSHLNSREFEIYFDAWSDTCLSRNNNVVVNHMFTSFTLMTLPIDLV